MKTHVVSFASLLVGRILAVSAFIAACTGCAVSTISARKQERPDAFNQASSEQQRIMQEGWINYGFTRDMVYIALGKPDRIVPGSSEGMEIWSYMNFQSMPRSSVIGAPKIIATQTDDGSTGSMHRHAVTDTRKKIEFEVRPDVGSEPPAEMIPELHVYFYQGKAIQLKIKKE